MAETFPFPTYQNGIVREAAVDEVSVPQNSVELAINLNFDRIGAVSGRPGLTRLNDQITASTSVLGIAPYANNAGTIFAALALVGTEVVANTGSGWATVRTGLTPGSKMRTTNFVDYTFMVNGHGEQALQTWGGTGNFGTNNVGSLPAGDFVENYRSRIWVANNATDKVYYSDVVTASNTITGGTSFLQISPQDGEKITGLKRHPRALLVFKQNHIYRIFTTNSTDPDPSIMRGTYSQESIVEAKDGLYYHHSSGFYKFNFDGEQEEISRPIIDIVEAIPRSAYDNVVGWADGDHVYWHVGDITISGVTIPNIVCRRTISTKVWTLYSYSKAITSAGMYDTGVELFQLVGDEDGNVLKFNTGTTDNGSDIFYDLITHFTYFTDNKTKTKSLTEIVALHENAIGASVTYQTDTDNQKDTNNAWKEGGTIRKDIFDTIGANAQNFTRMRLRISGSTKGAPILLRTFEALDLTIAPAQKS